MTVEISENKFCERFEQENRNVIFNLIIFQFIELCIKRIEIDFLIRSLIGNPFIDQIDLGLGVC